MDRNTIQSSLANLFNVVCLDEYEIDIVEELEKSITILDFVFSKKEDEEIQKLVGGELNPNNIMGTSLQPEKYNIPLYLILELIIKGLKDSKFKAKESIIKSIEKLEIFKERADKLEYDKKFNPNEELSPDVIDKIKSSNGLFSMEVVEIDGKECIAVNVKRESGTYQVKNGDIYGGDNLEIINLQTMLYDKDNKKLSQLKKIEKQRLLSKAQTKLKDIGKKYFKNGEIPKLWNLSEELIDKNINPEIRTYLSYLSTDLQKLLDENNINITLNRIAAIETIEAKISASKEIRTELPSESPSIREPNIEEKVSESKKKYSSRTPLFNFFRKKRSDSNQLEDKNGRTK